MEYAAKPVRKAVLGGISGQVAKVARFLLGARDAKSGPMLDADERKSVACKHKLQSE